MAHVREELLMEQVRQQVREQVREQVRDEVSIALRGIMEELHDVAGDLKALVRRMEKVALLLHQDELTSSQTNKATQCELTNISTSPHNTSFRATAPAPIAAHAENVHRWRLPLHRPEALCCSHTACVKNGTSVTLPNSSVYRTFQVSSNESQQKALVLPGFKWHIIGYPQTAPKPKQPSEDDNNNDVTACTADDVILGKSPVSPNEITMSPGSSTTATSGSYSVREDSHPSIGSNSHSSGSHSSNYNLIDEQFSSKNLDANFSYERIGVVKKRHHGLRKLSLAYSISPEEEHCSNKSSSEGSQQDDMTSPGSQYDGLYERELDERLELEYDDDLELFETIENGIHGTVADETAVINATYNRDINPWRQYSGVSVETISDDLWSDYSDTHSDNIVNENFVAPLLNKAKQHTNFHWRTYVEP